ncbi:MAG: hypothetical protein ABIL76_04395 [candidate division WOR-3 bacterium]
MERIIVKPSINEILSYPKIVSGHQPIFFYYGILLKAILLKSHKNHLFLIADHDERNEIYTWTIDDNFNIHKISFLKFSEKIIFEKFPSVSQKHLFNFYKSFKALTNKKLLKKLEFAFELAFNLVKEVDNYSDFMISWTFKFCNLNLNVKKVSEISKTDEFKNFVIEVSNSDFNKKFNEVLLKLKRKPFRLLKENELPFWKVINNKREPLYKDDLKNLDKLEIRPRAWTLTLFFRKNGWAFLHGKGGYGYDKIIEMIFDNLSPKFLITGDKFLDLDIEIKSFDEFYKLKNIISDLKWHSEYLFKCFCPLKDINYFFNWNLNLDENYLKYEKFNLVLNNPKAFNLIRQINEKLFFQAKESSIYNYLIDLYKRAKNCSFREFPFFIVV